jgi:rhodanese-related sulfurtransferase
MKSAIPTSAELLLEKIASLQLKTDHPIVLMCEQGGSSLSCSKELINRGFVNVYCVKGGWKNVLVEAGLR